MLSKNSGYLGSFIVHAGIVALCAAAATLVAVDRPPVAPGEDTGGGTVILVDDPGGPGGSGGGAPAPRVSGEPTMRPVSRLNVERLLGELKQQQERDVVKPVQPRPDPVKPAAPVSKPTIHSGPPAGQARPVRPVGIVGVQLGGSSIGSANTSGAPGMPGVGAGSRVGAGPGSGGAAGSLLASQVRAAFAARFIPLFREQGGDISASRDRCEVKLRVSAGGSVSFAGWSVSPADALTEKLVRQSVESMPAVEIPPGGEPITVIIPVSASVDE